MNKAHANTVEIKKCNINFIIANYSSTSLFKVVISFINSGLKGKSGVLEMNMTRIIKVACKSSFSPSWEIFAVNLQNINFCSFITILLFL